VFLASGLGIYLLETASFRCQRKNPLAFLFPKMAISDATGGFPWFSCSPARNFPLKTLQEMPHARREPEPYVISDLYYTSELQMLQLTFSEKKFVYTYSSAFYSLSYGLKLPVHGAVFLLKIKECLYFLKFSDVYTLYTQLCVYHRCICI
jgi:hypothetical protein